ncbi:MAG: divalent-cation tolerance protein CutA [Elusimicrobia bacterium]|nr:divalent-cation tolerance protein CutA [Elusimicrobiota bacterium]
MTNILVCFVTVPKAKAKPMARKLVDMGVAACVNVIGPVSSHFFWEGKVDQAAEHLLIIKTTVAGFPGLKKAVIKIHPYSIPEIIALPVTSGHKPYLEWVRRSVSRERR